MALGLRAAADPPSKATVNGAVPGSGVGTSRYRALIGEGLENPAFPGQINRRSTADGRSKKSEKIARVRLSLWIKIV